MGAASPPKASESAKAKAAARRKAKRAAQPEKKNGRPRKLIADAETLRQIEFYGRLKPLLWEVAAAFKVCEKTLREFLKKPEVAEVWLYGQSHALLSLRRNQFEQAKTSPVMAIHLGKNYLGQTDKVTNEISGPDGNPMEFRNLSGRTDEQLKLLKATAIALAGGLGSLVPEPEPVPAERGARGGEEVPGGDEGSR